ncbi:flavohemoprotein-like protein [Moritella sp. PE36]|uniref:2Fe-2S iron-sulfur cluster-binding protein n=1 Tax=Moritella sp. PE36 TaxID=58051 RepID=UPI00015684A3|nr:2Fe-2S iron-sulfur cluster-binding protein [Moritella sp. PE36]EDM67667.1 flavohemoprotein-like protein [Moritella sp. PE36]
MNETFKSFTILKKHKESTLVTSFHLTPTDGSSLWDAEPGQYLTLRIPTGTGFVLRSYSISGDVENLQSYRISVKRETANVDWEGALDGIGSCWLHDLAKIGDEIDISAPRGQFVLDNNSVRPIVLLSAGVGLTPLVSMLHSLKKRENDVWFIHVCDNSDVHAFKSEVNNIAVESLGRIRTHLIYRHPTHQDEELGLFDSQDVIDRQLIQSLLPLDDYDLYLCGTESFMSAMFQLFRSIGLPTERIFYEFFGKAKTFKTIASESKPDLPVLTNEQEGFEVVFANSGSNVRWVNDSNSLLDLAEQSGLTPEYSCRDGICGSCTCDLIEGFVEYNEEPLNPVPEGQILLCCSSPKSRVVLGI